MSLTRDEIVAEITAMDAEIDRVLVTNERASVGPDLHRRLEALMREFASFRDDGALRDNLLRLTRRILHDVFQMEEHE